MTQFLPSNLLALFAPREPLKYLPPAGKLPCEKTFPPYTGVAAFLSQFEEAKDVPPPTRVETKEEKRERLQKERSEQIAYKLEQDLAMWDPSSDPTLFGDPFKTLFCSRINFDTSESKLRREFDVYGPVKKVHMVVNSTSGKPRGYAFVEFEHERDMHAAYKHADGKKIDSRRILVDVERGRTVKGWRPRRLGGGLGNTRKGGSEVNTRYSGREDFVGRDRDVPDDRKGLESRDDRGPRGPSPSERGRRRSLSRERPPARRRSRSPRGGERPDRERDNRGERRVRRGSRERRRSPEKIEVKKELLDENDIKTEPGMEDNKDAVARKRTRRSRSPRASGIDRDRRRSRSRDRKRSRRSRSRERRGGSKQRDRSRRTGADGGEAGAQAEGGPFIKQELDNLGEYDGAAAAGFEEADVKLGEGIGGAAHEGENGGQYNRLEDL